MDEGDRPSRWNTLPALRVLRWARARQAAFASSRSAHADDTPSFSRGA